jgi:hypothetical protein
LPSGQSILDSLEGDVERSFWRARAHAREALGVGVCQRAPHRKLAVDLGGFEFRLASMDLLGGCFEQERQIGMWQNLCPQAYKRRSGP